MNINIITKKLKQVLSEKKLNLLEKETGFTQRKRNITESQLVITIYALGDKHARHLSDRLS